MVKLPELREYGLTASRNAGVIKINSAKLCLALAVVGEELFDSTFIAAIIAFVQAGVSLHNELFAYLSRGFEVMQQPVIISATRTAIGKFQGSLKPFTAPQIGAIAVRAAIERAGLEANQIDEVIMGCVLQAGLGQNPARQAALKAGLPDKVAAMTINKVCGSGLKSVMLAAQSIALGDNDIIVAGGMESMSNAPYLLPKARAGYRMGHGEILDHMFYDGLQSPWDGKLMGCFADATAARYGFTRAEQDAFAAESVRRAVAAVESGAFAGEIAPVRSVHVATTRRAALGDSNAPSAVRIFTRWTLSIAIGFLPASP